MAFTNLETVRQHLSQSGVVRDTLRDVPVQLSGTSPTALLHANLKTGSVVVKGKEIGTPRYQAVTLANEPVLLGTREVIPDSVVVASDSSLGTMYTENIDYHVSHPDGTISRIASGGIPSAAQVAVWYYAYRLYREGEDFAVNYERGTLRRLPAGTIEDGQTVFVDYRTLTGGFEDVNIENAIVEADNEILRLIDPDFQEEGDQTLGIAETYLALAILFRMRASGALENANAAGSAEIAKGWRELADRYETDGLKLVARYAAKVGSLSSPVSVKGGLR